MLHHSNVLISIISYYYFIQWYIEWWNDLSLLADLPGGVPNTCPPRVQILSFWCTKFSKYNCLGSQCPLLRGLCPPAGNPGSATGHPIFLVFGFRNKRLNMIRGLSLNLPSFVKSTDLDPKTMVLNPQF